MLETEIQRCTQLRHSNAVYWSTN